MNYLHQFTPDERRLVMAAQQRFEHAISFIAELHQIKGNVMVAPDFSGLLAPDAPQVPQHVNGATTPQVLK